MNNLYQFLAQSFMRIVYSAVVPIRIGTTAGFLIPVTLLWLGALSARADYYYVATNGAGGDFKDWTRAATNIQEAVNIATNGDTVLVSNGIYTTVSPTVYISGVNTNTSVVFLTNNIILKSVNGPAVTIIDGNNLVITARVVYATRRATLDGFTIRNGYAKKPWCTGNEDGGGLSFSGGGIETNCIVYNNRAVGSGGGISLSFGTTATNIIANCIIYSNSSSAGSAGGIYLNWFAYNSTAGSTIIQNCIIYQNTSRAAGLTYGGGGIYTYASPVVIRNCLIYCNSSRGVGGGVYFSYTGGFPALDNCTIVSNTADMQGGGLYCDVGTIPYSARNLIVYNNSCATYPDTYASIAIMTNCCIRDTNGVVNWNTSGNITNNPLFVNKDIDNYHLTGSSPCFNTGTNQTWMSTGVDLEGRARIRYGRVDIGAYEHINKGTLYRFH